MSSESTTAVSLLARLSAGETSSEEVVRSLLDRAQTRRAAQRFRPSRSGGRAGPGPSHRRAAQERRNGRPPGGRARGDQGRALRRGRADDLRQPHAAELPSSLRRHRDRQAQGRRCDLVRQDQYGRVRHGLVDREQLVRTDQEPLGRVARARRLVGGLGGGRRGRPGSAGSGHRHRRLDPPAGGRLRRRRAQADLRPGQPLWPDRVRQLARSGRPVRPRPRRHGPPLERDRRARPPRFHERRPAHSRLFRDPEHASRIAAHRRCARVLRRGARPGGRRRHSGSDPGLREGGSDHQGGLSPPFRVWHPGLLPRRLVGVLEQSRPLRRHDLRPPRSRLFRRNTRARRACPPWYG